MMGIGFATNHSINEVKASENVSWMHIVDPSEIKDGERYAITYEGNILVPSAYTGSSPVNSNFNPEVTIPSMGWIFKNVGQNEWRITDSENWLKNEYDGPGGLRTQATEPTTYWTAEAVEGQTARISLTSSYEGHRQIGYYDYTGDWRSLPTNWSEGTQLELYMFTSPLESLSVETPEPQSIFCLGEEFNHVCLVINANYEDGSSAALFSGFEVTDADTMVLGKQSVPVTYKEKTVYYDVQVTLNGTIATDSEQATAFANYVMTGIGNNAAGNCTEVYNELTEEYNYLSSEAKNEFNQSTDQLFVNARARYQYLATWVGFSSNSEQLPAIYSTSKVSFMIFLVAVLSFTLLGSYFFIRKRSKKQ